MTRIKLCGLSRTCDIEKANELVPEYIGFVFAQKSPRYISFNKAFELKNMLLPNIKAVGVFVDEKPEQIFNLLKNGIIDIVQLHGNEDEEYINKLRQFTDKPIIKAFCIKATFDIKKAEECSADYVLLDSGAGSGEIFNWNLIQAIKRPFFLAGGLSAFNVGEVIRQLRPYAVDVSSGIETKGYKDNNKMAEFVATVRREDRL